jgi:WD40 repeat protein
MTQPQDNPQLSQAIADYLEAVDAGRNPTAADYLTRYPHLAAPLQAFFADQVRLARLAGPITSRAAATDPADATIHFDVDAPTRPPVPEPDRQAVVLPDRVNLMATGTNQSVGLITAARGTTGLDVFRSMNDKTLVAFNPDGREMIRVTSGTNSGRNRPGPAGVTTPGTIEVWDVVSCQRRRTLDGVSGLCYALALSPDGTMLAAAIGNEVKLYRLNTGVARVFPGRADSVAFSPDSQRLAVSTTLRVKLWDASTRRDLLTLRGAQTPGGRVGQISFTRDGLLVGTGVGGVHVFDGRPWAPAP